MGITTRLEPPGQPETPGEPFLTAPVSSHLPGWQLAAYLEEDPFAASAAKTESIYLAAGLSAIAIIALLAGVMAAYLRWQIRLTQLRNDLVAAVSHELKTPLASMRVLVDTLREGRCTDGQRRQEYLDLIARENERLSRLIDNFLTFSRMERNKQAFQMRPVSPVSIARTAAEAVKTKFSRGSCRFETDIPDELPTIKADHDAMVTVLVNLLDNAYKYSADEKRIKLSVGVDSKPAPVVSFRVSDNGLGIPRRALKKIFRRFYQVDRSLSRRTEGCGLGLSIAKFIIDAHQGAITVESKPAQGSTFTVTIPAAPLSPPPPTPVPRAT